MKTPNDIKPVIALVADAIDKRKDLTIARLQAKNQADPAARMELEAQIGKNNKFKGSGPARLLLIAFIAFLALIGFVAWLHYNT